MGLVSPSACPSCGLTLLDKRMNRQLKQYMDICVRCHLQIGELNELHELGPRVAPVMELVVEAMPLPGR